MNRDGDEAQDNPGAWAREWVQKHASRLAALEGFLDAYVLARAEVFVEARGQGREAKIVGLDALAMELHRGRKS